MRKDMKEQHPLVWRFLRGVIPGLFLVVWITVSATEPIPTCLLPHPLEIAEAGYAYVLGQPGEGPYAGRFPRDADASQFRVDLPRARDRESSAFMNFSRRLCEALRD
jgi:ABC-type nitrate/sulfonate/bicarbonate transport system permease component